MTDREIMQQALEALLHMCNTTKAQNDYNAKIVDKALVALEAALAQPEQAPKLTDAGADTNISKGLEPKGEGLVALHQPEQEPFKPDWVSYRQGVADGAAQIGQEPVAWMVKDQVDGCRYPSALKNPAGSINGESQPLYTAPPRKPWVGLTDSDMHTIRDDAFVKNVDDIEWALQMVRRIETKLKEKNHGSV